MCIAKSVGINGINNRQDVKIVQILLNGNKKKIGLNQPLSEDGIFGKQTRKAIADFQTAVNIKPTGQITPRDANLIKLRDGLEAGVSADRVAGIIMSKRQTIEIYQPALCSEMARNEINTPRRIAHFLAQIGHESGAFRYSEEIASGQAYEGRRDLGNTQPGDGKRFKGRGLIQLTGRRNYQDFGKFVGMNLLTDEGARSGGKNSKLAVLAAIWFWNTRKLNQLADADDVVKITKRINGGINDLQDRRDYLVRAKFFMNCTS